MTDIKKLIKEEGIIRKYDGVVPEGFILVHEKSIEQLKDFDVWKDWKNDIITLDELNKISLRNE